ncbi:MAG: prolyl oligopeptidase family serine peptidase [Kordiimonadaceae bacterium]|nr:prolyl oligopeptidase family serine peptidase [Kordiimonadaceae bacterium]
MLGWLPVVARDGTLLDTLVRAPYLAAPSISADGHFLSALIRQKNGTSNVTVWRAIGAFSEAETLPYRRLEVRWMAWVGGGRLLMSLREKGLVLYDAHVKRLRPLIEGGGPRPDELPPVLLSHLPDDPTTILMQWEDPGQPGFPAVYRVNAISGQSQKIVSAWKPVIRWYASPEGEVHLGEGYKGRRQYLYARRSDGSWEAISRKDYFSGPALSVLAVETGGATALVLSAHAANTRELWRLDIASGKMQKRLAGHKAYDISTALIDPVTDVAVGATYVAEALTTIIWQEKQRKGLAKMAKRIGTGHVMQVLSSRDGRRSLYKSASRNRPSKYYLLDSETDGLSALPYDDSVALIPLLDTVGVAIDVPKMRQRMHALLSYGKDGLTGKTIVLIHGGPVSRVQDRFTPYVSWLVANGYNVLRPNFRGSSGYGERWRKAGYAEWGRRMQSDVRAAGEWLVDEGINETGDMCIAGGSYGGYAALLSSLKDDDLFACAFSLNGVTSLPHLIAYLSKNRFHELTVPRILGRLSARSLRRRSPLNRVSLVRMPVMMLHSTLDRNVPYHQGLMMAEALAKHGKNYKFLPLIGAEHQLKREAERRIHFESATDFFNRYLGGGLR